MTVRTEPCQRCGEPADLSVNCGAWVCSDWDCGHHNGLTRCYCGWSESGGDGRAELEAMGEVIE